LADIFVSWSRLDEEGVKPIVDRLSSLGYSLCWERRPGGGAEAERELEAARAVLAVWSHNARNSTWVYAEASHALEHNKFLQLRLDHAALPAPFAAMPAADMSGEREEWGLIEDALARLIRKGEAPAPPEPAPRPGLLATPNTVGAPKLLAVATVATLFAYAGAVSAAVNGLMSPDQLQIALTGVIGVAGASAALVAHRLVTVARAGG
jgi:TIR domain